RLVRESPRFKRYQQGKLLLRGQTSGILAAGCSLFFLRKDAGTVHVLIGKIHFTQTPKSCAHGALVLIQIAKLVLGNHAQGFFVCIFSRVGKNYTSFLMNNVERIAFERNFFRQFSYIPARGFGGVRHVHPFQQFALSPIWTNSIPCFISSAYTRRRITL